ncbi:T9SS type A sorting domain-containing protein [Phaeocystidibacter luteus]|uniref:T9SS type A sorting domain-containing protein n=1 Tax=Phaeocystidibacter luteus TaxID=911197 RepID=A0A6N6RCW1_9FLAO|nr:T9SS type A sorting domain-containing protein [Phaeocystidibacter luteus]KAB2805477.1 T9SS type A sorting domain-containing protein [Phaeocystidibacter luteus]
MKRLLILLAFAFLSLSSFHGNAAHTIVSGGSLTYEYVGNNQFVFTLNVVSTCPDDFASFVSTTSISNGTMVHLDTVYSLESGCTYPCDTSAPSYSNTVLCVYKSSPTTIPMPANGVEEFYWSVISNFRPFGSANVDTHEEQIYFSVKMYAAGYPRSSVQVEYVGSDFHPSNSRVNLHMPFYSTTGDSTYSSLTSTLNANGTTKNYLGHLSPNYPINGFVSHNGSTGEIVADSLATGTWYYVAQKVQGISNFGLTSEVLWERGYYAPALFPTTIDTPEVFVSHNPNLQLSSNADSTNISLFVARGDTGQIDFKLISSVANPLEYRFRGVPAGSSDMAIANKPGYVNPSPAIPQISFDFSWMPDSSSQSYRTVILTAHDFSCPGVPVVVTLHLYTSPPDIEIDTVLGCYGGMVTLPAPLVPDGDWMPGDSVAKVSPTTFTTTSTQPKLYSYFVNGVPIQSAWVIGINPPQPTIGSVNGGPGLTNANQFEGADWYYFDVLIDTNVLALPSTAAWGNYQAQGYVDQCRKWSPVVPYQRPNSVIQQFIQDTLANGFEVLPTGTQLTWMVEKDSPGNLWPQSLIFPGATGAGQFVVEVDTSGTLVYSDTSEAFGPYAKRMTFPHAFEGFEMLWSNGKTFEFTVTVIGGDIVVPVGDEFVNHEYFGGFKHKVSSGLPINSAYFMPFVIQAYSGIGVEELSNAEWRVYPNPASDYLQIEGAEYGQSYAIINQVGQTVQSGVITEQAISLNELADGIYFIRIGEQTEKFVVSRR